MTYNMRIADSTSRTYYYLRIPAYRMKMGNSPFLRIEHPYISKQQGPERYKASPKIPNAIVEAAKHKTAEIASYLSSL